MKKITLTLIRFYQKHLTWPHVCRYSPTCSEYTREAIIEYGIFHGLKLGLFRVLHCHPWGGTGYDPLPRSGV